MAGEMGLTISPVSIALHSTGYSSLSACRGCEMRVVQAGAADLVASPPSSQAKNLHDIGLLATGSSSLQLIELPVKLQEPHRVPPTVPTRVDSEAVRTPRDRWPVANVLYSI